MGGRVSLLFIVVAILSIAVSPLVGSLPEPGDNVGVVAGPESALSPSLAVDPSGVLHLVWSDDRAGERGIHYARSADGTMWTPAARIDPPGADSYMPRIAVDLGPGPFQGRLYVTFERRVQSRWSAWLVWSDGGSSWSAAQRVDTAPAGVSAFDGVVAASAGRAYVAWSDDRVSSEIHIFLRASTDGGITWGPGTRVSSRETMNLGPVLAAAGDTVVAVWRQIGPLPGIASARSDDDAASWHASVLVQGGPYDEIRTPAVYVDMLGTAHVAWSGWPFPMAEGDLLYARSSDGRSWSPPVVIDDDLGLSTPASPSISALAGTVWVAWSDDRDGDGDVFASWSADGVVWGDGVATGADLRVDDTDRNADPADDRTEQRTPTVATGGFGVYVAWEDFRAGTSDIYFSELRVSPLVITEIQDEPAALAQVEVYNFARVPFDVTGATLVAGATTVDLSPLGGVPARGHVVIGAPASADLRVSLDLGTEGARVEIRRGAETLATAGSGSFGTATDPLPGESTARYANAMGYSEGWTRSSVPSFHARNSVAAPDRSPDLVLNEVLYRTNATDERFVELDYRGTASLNLSGFRLVADVVHTVLGGVATPGARLPLLAYDRAPPFFDTLDEAGDNVYLYDASGRLLDMVGWTSPHGRGLSLARVEDGLGGTTAYDDPSALASGWAFDRSPTPSHLELGPSQSHFADIGATVRFDMLATNRHPAADYVNLVPSSPAGWSVALAQLDGTPLQDSAGDPDSIPDLGLVPRDGSVPFVADVAIPVATSSGEGDRVLLEARMGVLTASATLTVRLRPHLELARAVDPSTVYVSGAGPPYNEVASVTVSLRGTGLPLQVRVPQDVILQIDVSGSMSTSDPTNLRVAAVKGYIDAMQDMDRASVLGFHHDAWIVNNRTLTSADARGKALLRGDADTLACSPICLGFNFTDIDDAIQLGNNWMVAHGNRSRSRAEILLTDGVCSPDPCTRTNSLLDQAVREGIAIFAVGLGSEVDDAFLRNIAERTGGQYFYADTPEDLIWIYEDIQRRTIRTAALDPNLADDVPMVEDVVPAYLTVLPPFVNPATGSPRNPSFLTVLPDRTVLQWNVSRVDINETWSVAYRVTSDRMGLVNVSLYPDARVRSQRWDGVDVTQPIPQAALEVLPIPTPPSVVETSPPNGTIDVALEAPIWARFSETMDVTTVTWVFSPPATVTPSWTSSDALTFDHAAMAECTQYSVEITGGADLEGERLVPGPAPNPWSFRTICTPPYVVSTRPVNGEAFVPLDASIVLTFSESMDIATVTVAVAPDVAVSPWWSVNDTVLTLTHSVPLAECTSFIVTVGGEDRDGNPLAPGPVPNPWSFSTMCPPLVTYMITRAPETGTVLVDNISYAVPASFAWVPGESHRLVAPDIDSYGASRFVFAAWDDGRPRDHVVTVGTANRTITAQYALQHAATLTLLGLRIDRPASIAYTAFGSLSTDPAFDTWSSWVDDGSDVVADSLVAGNPGERYVTMDATSWTVLTPLAEVVSYVRQLTATLSLFGLRSDRAASIESTTFGVQSIASGFEGWSSWVDDGSRVVVDDIVVGAPGERFATRDATSWRVLDPMGAVVTYVHQFTATLHIEGLDGHQIRLAATSFGEALGTTASTSWSSWVDAGRDVSTDDMLTIGERERYRTEGMTRWTVSAPLEETIAYLHQFRPRVTLQGTDPAHSVGAAWREDGTDALDERLAGEWFEWADEGSQLTFEETTTGTPPRTTEDPTSFLVDSAFDAVIRYAAPVSAPTQNWKPLLALAYFAALLLAGYGCGTRALDRHMPRSALRPGEVPATIPLSEKLARLTIAQIAEKVRGDRRFTRLLLVVPSATVEAGAGVLSFFTGVLRVPEAGSWFPVGFWVNTLVLAVGLSLDVVAWRQGYRMTEDDLLALAESRAAHR